MFGITNKSTFREVKKGNGTEANRHDALTSHIPVQNFLSHYKKWNKGTYGVHIEMYTYICFKHYRKIKSTAVKAQYKQYLKGSLTVAKESTYLLKNWQIFPHTVR